MAKNRNRMARAQDRERESHPVQMVKPQDPPDVMQCPRCGAARINGWDRYGGGKGRPYKQCRACGTKVRIDGDRLTVVG